MSTQEAARKVGESGVEKDSAVKNFYDLAALVLAKYGMLGLVVAYFGWINWQQHEQIVRLTLETVKTSAEQTEAVRALTKAIDRLEGRP